jgi:hypothetical protein
MAYAQQCVLGKKVHSSSAFSLTPSPQEPDQGLERYHQTKEPQATGGRHQRERKVL